MASVRRKPTTACCCCSRRASASAGKTLRADWLRSSMNATTPIFDAERFAYESAYRIELFGDEIESLSQIDPLFGTVKQKYARLPIYPKSHYVVQPERKV